MRSVIAICFVLWLVNSVAATQAYKCTASNGTVVYSSTPCHEGKSDALVVESTSPYYRRDSDSAPVYKCKDAKGNWAEDACTGAAAPPQPPQKPYDWREWRPKIGMTSDEVVAARRASEAQNRGTWFCCNYWLLQPEVNRTTSARSVREQWVFRLPGSAQVQYLYFENGVVTSIQD